MQHSILKRLLEQLSHPHNEAIKPILISIQHINNIINLFLIEAWITLCEFILVSVWIQTKSKGEWFVGIVVIKFCKFEAVEWNREVEKI